MPAAILRLSRHAALFLLLICGISVRADAQGNSCPPITDTEKAKIVVYLSKLMGVPETENLEIDSDELVSGTCYRRLAVKGRTLPPPDHFSFRRTSDS